MSKFHVNSNCGKCIQWDDKEFDEVSSRILKLTDDQIIQLFQKVGIVYKKTPMEEIIAEMRESESSIPMDVLTSEARSKKDLLKWIDYFENNREKNSKNE